MKLISDLKWEGRVRIPEFRVQYNHFNKNTFLSDCLQYVSYVQMINILLDIRTAF